MGFVSHRTLRRWAAAGLALGLFLLSVRCIAAQESTADQSTHAGAVIAGRTESGSAAVYRLSGLTAGDTLYANVTRTSGDLDPMLFLVPGDTDVRAAGSALIEAGRAASQRGADPLVAMAEAANQLTWTWDDDSGAGYDAQFSFTLPEDGDYALVIASNPVVESFGDFRLRVGVNTPEILSGQAPSVGGLDIALEQASLVESVQVLTGTVSLDAPETALRLVDMRQGDTFTAYAETTDGTLVPALVLEDFGGKALAADNLAGSDATAGLSFTFEQNPTNYQLRLGAASPGGNLTFGDYRLVLGRNVPGAINGKPAATGPAIVKAPIPVTVALKIDQVTDVDQVAENFSVVANMQLEWRDPKLAFSPDECDCRRKLLRSDRVITDYLTKNNINEWPASFIYNQQGGRNVQSQLLAIEPDGSATYFERATATLQAPDFNFRRFPFDTQQFYVRVQSIFEEEYFTFVPDAARSGFGPQLGEEQWIFSNDNFTTSSITVNDRSQAVFAFTTHRHLNFYIFRIFVPVLLIILVSWVTFFLHDYGRRIEVASGNLLLFIAYNFTIANDLPRIGYLTFMDFILISTFVITGFVVILNVIFRRLEANGKGELLARWDRILVWVYPLLYLLGGLVVYFIFF